MRPPLLPGPHRPPSSAGGGGIDADRASPGACGRLLRCSALVLASLVLATATTAGVLNFALLGAAPPSLAADLAAAWRPPAAPGALAAAAAAASAAASAAAGPPRRLALVPGGAVVRALGAGAPPPPPPAAAAFKHPFPDYSIYTLPDHDASPRCARSGICDGDHSCGADGLGCVTGAAERKARVREAIRWSWKGYRRGRPPPLQGDPERAPLCCCGRAGGAPACWGEPGAASGRPAGRAERRAAFPEASPRRLPRPSQRRRRRCLRPNAAAAPPPPQEGGMGRGRGQRAGHGGDAVVQDGVDDSGLH
jgi:hypothetical protein